MSRDFSSIIAYLRCPLCASTMHFQPGTVRCEQKHAFDISRQGYVNFAGAVSSRLSERGDNTAMVRARDAFLSSGHFTPLVDTLLAVLRAHGCAERAPGVPRLVVESGCGTGYYLDEVVRACRTTSDGAVTGIGLDISRPAIQRAARRHSGLAFVVADISRRLPLATGCVDLLLNVFSPRHPAEFSRVARPGAHLVCVIPGPGHLAELRREFHLIGIEPNKEAKVVQAFADHAALVDRVSIRFEPELDRTAAETLVAMTPSSLHQPGPAQRPEASTRAITVTADFVVLVFQFCRAHRH